MQFYKNHKVFDNSRLIAFCNDKVKSSRCFRFFFVRKDSTNKTLN